MIAQRTAPEPVTDGLYFCPNCWLYLRADLVIYQRPDPRPRCANCETIIESDMQAADEMLSLITFGCEKYGEGMEVYPPGATHTVLLLKTDEKGDSIQITSESVWCHARNVRY